MTSVNDIAFVWIDVRRCLETRQTALRGVVANFCANNDDGKHSKPNPIQSSHLRTPGDNHTTAPRLAKLNARSLEAH